MDSWTRKMVRHAPTSRPPRPHRPRICYTNKQFYNPRPVSLTSTSKKSNPPLKVYEINSQFYYKDQICAGSAPDSPSMGLVPTPNPSNLRTKPPSAASSPFRLPRPHRQTRRLHDRIHGNGISSRALVSRANSIPPAARQRRPPLYIPMRKTSRPDATPARRP